MTELQRRMEKLAASDRKLKEEAKQSRKIESYATLGEVAGALGATYTSKILGKKLLHRATVFSPSHAGKDIKDLGPHLAVGGEGVDADLLKTLPKDIQKRIGGKTPSKEKLKELSDLTEGFLKKHKLREGGLKVNIRAGNKLGDNYNIIKNTANLGTSHRAVALHELGHAADYRGSVAKLLGRAVPATLIAGSVPFAMTVGDTIRRKNPDSVDAKVIGAIQNHPIATNMAAYSIATLYPEAKASYLALRYLASQKGKGAAMRDLKTMLGPAFGTYMVGALPLIGASWAMSKAYEGSREKTAASKSDYDKAFSAIALSVGIPIALRNYYLHKGKGGEAVRSLRREMRRGNAEFHGTPFHEQSEKAIKSHEDWMVRNPELGSLLLGGGAGTLLASLFAPVIIKSDIKKALLRR